MSLEPGQTLSHYRLIEEIGKGGMGVVWRAEDPNLRRQVALKVLPPDLVEDPERRRRLVHEARAAAAINHPHIATVHEVGEADGLVFLAMEYVEGSTLRALLEERALSVGEALRLANEVAEGLAAAHDVRVIHRDLKPENVMVRPDGHVTILDFGLAKVQQEREDLSPSKVSEAETLTDELTRQGRVLGTAAYMSPEQARGEALDVRTDVFSFGSMLYEMVTGEMPFAGRSATDILSAVLRDRPLAPSARNAEVPPELDRIVGKCLEKEARDRYQHTEELAVDLRKLGRAVETGSSRAATPSGGIQAPRRPAGTEPGPARRKSPWLFALVAGASVVVAAAAGILLWDWLFDPGGGDRSPAPVVRLRIDAPEGKKFVGGVGISPDGTLVGYVMTPPWPPTLYLHSLERGAAEPVAGTAGISRAASSPDGRWMAFVAPPPPPQTKLRLSKVPVDGSAPPLALMDGLDRLPHGASVAWPRDEEIVALLEGGGEAGDRYELLRIPADGSPPGPPVEVDADASIGQLWNIKPLPGGRHLLANVFPFENGALAVIDIETGQARFLPEVRSGTTDFQVDASWSPTEHLLVAFRGALTALPFDRGRLVVTGPAVAVADGIGRYALSRSGVLVYKRYVAPAEHYLALVDRDGREERWGTQTFSSWHQWVEVSGDGSTMAVHRSDPDTGRNEIWVSDVEQPRLRPLVRSADGICHFPALSYDGMYLISTCSGDQRIYLHRTDGEGEPALLADDALKALSISPDGRWLLFAAPNDEGKQEFETFILPLEPDADGSRERRPLGVTLDSPFEWMRFSPDGRWIAYDSRKHGDDRVFLRRFDGDLPLGPEIAVTEGRSLLPQWSRRDDDGRQELVFADNGTRWSVWIGSASDGIVSEPRKILEPEQRLMYAGALPDGRFLAALVEEAAGPDEPPIEVVLNWTEELNRRLARPD